MIRNYYACRTDFGFYADLYSSLEPHNSTGCLLDSSVLSGKMTEFGMPIWPKLSSF